MKNTGLIISRKTPKETIDALITADLIGVKTAWSISGGIAPDLLTYYAAAAVKTKQITFGTSILPILPRHPIQLCSQALVLESLAPGRLRLGIGTSHKKPMEDFLGLSFNHPQDKLGEYVTILRQALWTGSVDFSGTYYSVHGISLPDNVFPPKTPILVSALREKGFTLAGEISDGAISWMCPVSYLVNKALPALTRGAKMKKRKTPPLIAHVPVAYCTDAEKVYASSIKQLHRYGRMPFYQYMFADAGYPVGKDGSLDERLIENLVIYGTRNDIKQRLLAIFHQGIDEILISPIVISDQKKEEESLMQTIAQ